MKMREMRELIVMRKMRDERWEIREIREMRDERWEMRVGDEREMKERWERERDDRDASDERWEMRGREMTQNCLPQSALFYVSNAPPLQSSGVLLTSVDVRWLLLFIYMDLRWPLLTSVDLCWFPLALETHLPSVDLCWPLLTSIDLSYPRPWVKNEGFWTSVDLYWPLLTFLDPL